MFPVEFLQKAAKKMYIHHIKPGDATPGMQLAEAVYADAGAGALVARKGYVIDETLLRVLKRREIETVPVWLNTPPEEPDRPTYTSDAVTEKRCWVKGILSEELKKEALGNIKELFGNLDLNKTANKTTAYQSLKNLDTVVGDLIRALSHDESGLVHISDLKQYDEYTYHHSISVSLLSIATGRELGLKSHDLLRLGRCAMLHDIGKQAIPLEILNKKGKLDNDEFAQIKFHSSLGASSLKAHAVGDVELWNAIMFHHEKMNGTGYPKGLVGNEIPLFSKIISVADVYDAITSYRPYRSPMLPDDAFRQICKDAGIAFDNDVVTAFFEKLEFYPVNTIVKLSDERLALVAETDLDSRLTPVVRIWGTDEIIRLAENNQLHIIEVLNHSNLPPGYEFT